MIPTAVISLTTTFNKFFESEKSSAILLIFCTLIAILMTNSIFGQSYLNFWQAEYSGLSLEHWVNDGLMAIFFPAYWIRTRTRTIRW